MLLNYLYKNFFEESEFATELQTTMENLRGLIEARVFPAPSYVLELDARSRSFVCDNRDRATYRFHLKGCADWYKTLARFGLDTEDRARAHFTDRYNLSKETFFAGPLGRELCAAAANVPYQFDEAHADMTWKHFLEGVYGVCTRDGQPETVFLKQALVMFIEEIIRDAPRTLRPETRELLARAVTLLDGVESDFAPHEVCHSSRQRCIIDIQETFLRQEAA